MRTRFVSLALASGHWRSALGQQRLPDGHPDLQGTYDLATLTPIERPAGAKADHDAGRGGQAGEAGSHAEEARATCPSKATGPLHPRAATDRRARRETWAAITPSGSILVPATPLSTGRSARRWSIDPPDGRVPPYTAGREATRCGAFVPADVGRAGEQRSGTRTSRLLRRPRAPSAGRALPAGIWFHFGTARRCRIISTTISIKSCRRRTR